MSEEIKLLDHGFVALREHMGSDLSIARNARVSYDADWRAGEDTGSDARLIHYLRNAGHNTPFECVTFTFDVFAPIFVFRQWHRHRTQSYNELSARYRELPEIFYIPAVGDIGVQHTDNKQMREDAVDEARDQLVSAMMRDQNICAFALYKRLIEEKVPREIARTILPVGTYSHMFNTVNLHNLFGFISERSHPHAQKEIRVYSDAMLQLIKPHVPIAVRAFTQSRLNPQFDKICTAAYVNYKDVSIRQTDLLSDTDWKIEVHPDNADMATKMGFMNTEINPDMHTKELSIAVGCMYQKEALVQRIHP